MHNSDRHLCKSCIYRMHRSDRIETGGHCDYIEIAGQSRGCTVENCDKYEKGPRKRRSAVRPIY